MNEETKVQAKAVSLKTLMTPTKTVEFDYPGCKDFTVELCYLAREELVKLRNRCLSQTFNRKTRSYEESMDDDKFVTEYTKAVIKGWKGLKYRYLEELLLVDIADLDPDDELTYTQENSELLMRNSNAFDTWITETIGDLENFTGHK